MNRSCRSQQGASWLADSYLADFSETSLRTQVGAFLISNNLNVPQDIEQFSAGSEVQNSANSECGVIIEALTLEPRETDHYEIVDLQGKVVSTMTTVTSTSTAQLPDGLYIAIGVDREGKQVRTGKLVVSNQQIISYADDHR